MIALSNIVNGIADSGVVQNISKLSNTLIA